MFGRYPMLMVALTAALLCAPAAAEDVREPARKPIWKSERHFKETQRGWEAMMDGDLADATGHFERVARRTRNDYERSQALFGLAQVAMLESDYERALGNYEEVVQLDLMPNKPHFEAIILVAELHFLAGRPDEAAGWLERWQREGSNAAGADPKRAERLQGLLRGEPDASHELGPMPIFRVQPSYPRDALIAGVEGSVTVRATVDPEGGVRSATIVAAEPPGVFDDVAMQAISHWRFVASDGETQITQTFAFVADD